MNISDASNDIERLTALRDSLAADLDAGASARDKSGLALQYMKVVKMLRELAPAGGDGADLNVPTEDEEFDAEDV